MADKSKAGGRNNGQTIKTPERLEIATAEKDLDIFAGWLRRLENPDPVILTEGRGKGLKLYDEVARDPHASAVLQSRYLAVAGCEWEIEPFDDAPKSRETADFVEQALRYSNFTQALSELMQAALYGFFVGEVIWEERDGAWLPGRIIGKHPRRFSFDLNRELRLLTPAAMIDGEPVPDRKFIVFTHGSTDNPYGRGLGQQLWWPVWFKKNGIKFWLVFLEKFGMPTGLGKFPPGTDKADIDKLLAALDTIQSETGIAIPNTMEMELLEAARTGNVTYETLCDYMDRAISKAVLGQTLTTEVNGEGSFAAGKVHNDVRRDILKADADLLSEVINGGLVKWIVDYNFADVPGYPTLWLRTDEEQDLKPLAERDQILGAMGLKIPVRYMYDTYAIPAPEKGEETIGSAIAGFAPPDGGGQFAEADANPTDRVADRLARRADGPMTAWIEHLRALAQKAGSLEELRDMVASAFPGMPVDRLAGIMAEETLRGKMIGRLEVEDGR